MDSMLPANAALPKSPTPLPNDQPPDPLTAIMSGAAGTWHSGHALYCPWRWAQRHRSHTRDWTATLRFHLDSRQQVEAIPQHDRTAETPTATNLCPVFAIHQIRALAMGGQLQPAIRTEPKPRQHTRPLCRRSSVPSAAPSYSAWRTPKGTEQPRGETRNTPP